MTISTVDRLDTTFLNCVCVLDRVHNTPLLCGDSTAFQRVRISTIASIYLDSVCTQWRCVCEPYLLVTSTSIPPRAYPRAFF